jgi:predicted pyridoxine 5'-phosphate oxidase superfamily flavin-nucleotide-binding protein
VGRMDEDVLRVLAQTKVIPVATASRAGVPNVVPMTFVKALGDAAVLIADNYMDKGARNLGENPHVSVCVWDLESKRAYQIKGDAEIHRSGPVYDDMVAWVKETKPDAPAKAAVVLNVASVFVCHAGPDRGNDVALA